MSPTEAESSYSSPGGNLTGLTDIDKTLTPKQLELLDELLPKTALVAQFINPTNPNMDHEITPTRAAARNLRRELILYRRAYGLTFMMTFMIHG
jgi:ABC-type uncharacterized transport system substrate-binding protein